MERGFWGGQIHTSRDYLGFRKPSRGPRYVARVRERFLARVRLGSGGLKSLFGGGVPSSHPSLGWSVFFLSLHWARDWRALALTQVHHWSRLSDSREDGEALSSVHSTALAAGKLIHNLLRDGRVKND